MCDHREYSLLNDLVALSGTVVEQLCLALLACRQPSLVAIIDVTIEFDCFTS